MHTIHPIGQDWAAAFTACDLDVVPDPMVMRIADLFIGGKTFATQSRLDPARVWNAIERNADSLIAFFHLLMTRERIPLIDYEYTFSTMNFQQLQDIAVVLHPPIYSQVKEHARNELAKVDLGRIPRQRLLEVMHERGDELEAVGYGWFPDPGPQFADSNRTLGVILLGGLIFGAYAQISGSDHVLQPTRHALLLEFTQSAEGPLWGAQQEAKLFDRLNAVVSTDPRLSSRDTELPPTILHYLMEQGPRNSRELLDKALELRAADRNFIDYRKWHRKLRSAWAMGTHSESDEKDVVDVTRELIKRYPPGHDPVDAPRLWSREIGLKATLGVKAAAEAGVEADLGKFPVSLPDWIRNWLVEGFQFRSHRKVLLRMALAKKHSDHLLLGLKRLWEAP
jgi:hypothetical protein